MYRYFKDLAIVKRPVLVSGKSTISPTGNTYNGFLKPISSEDGLYQDSFGQDFNFHTYDTADIKTSDILSIDGVDYSVKGVRKTTGFIIKYKKVLLTKSK